MLDDSTTTEESSAGPADEGDVHQIEGPSNALALRDPIENVDEMLGGAAVNHVEERENALVLWVDVLSLQHRVSRLATTVTMLALQDQTPVPRSESEDQVPPSIQSRDHPSTAAPDIVSSVDAPQENQHDSSTLEGSLHMDEQLSNNKPSIRIKSPFGHGIIIPYSSGRTHEVNPLFEVIIAIKD